MAQGSFDFHHAWQNRVTFVWELDVTALRRRAGLVENPAVSGILMETPLDPCGNDRIYLST